MTVTWSILTSRVCTNGVVVIPLGKPCSQDRQRFFRALELTRPITPSLNDCAFTNENVLTFNLLGEPGKQFDIEFSTNLVQWMPQVTFTATNPLTPVVLMQSNILEKCFFRAVQLPQA